MPDNPSDQLLGKPLTQQQFLALPKLDGLFWTMGLRPLSPLQHVTSAGAEAVIRLQVPDGVQVQGELADQQGKAQPLRSMVSFLKGQAEIHISFPAAGRWQVSIFAGPKGATQFAGVALLGFSAGTGSSLVYPTLYTSWYAAGCALVAPSSTPVAGQATRFALRVPGAQDVFLSQNNGIDRTELQRDATDPALFSATYTPQPSGPISVFALIPSLGSTATGLLQYS